MPKHNAIIKDSKTGKILQVLRNRSDAEIQAVIACLAKHFSLNVVRQ